MSFNITLGNLDQNLHGPSNPTALSQIITAAGNHKFTVHGAAAGSKLGPLTMDLAFAKAYNIRQTQKGSVSFGFCDANGSPIGQQGKDQDGACSTGPHAGLFWQATFHSAGDFTFTGGGN